MNGARPSNEGKGGGVARMKVNGSSETEIVAHNNQLRLSEWDKTLLDDRRGMEDRVMHSHWRT